MKTQNTILLFHISGGGGNNRKLSFHSETRIDKIPAFHNLFGDEDEQGNEIMRNGSGRIIMNAEELDLAKQTGEGTIDIDGYYDTWYALNIKDLSEAEFRSLDIDYQEKYLNEVNLIPISVLERINEENYCDMYNDYNGSENQLQEIIDCYIEEEEEEE